MRRLWIAFVMVSAIGFGILGWVGSRIYQEAPPIPERVLTGDGAVVVPDGDIGRGQNVWQTMGGMEVGSVWGHGSYVAPDWTADWLHREAVFILNDWARAEAGRSYLELEPERQAALRERLTRLMRRNGYDPVTRALTIEPVRARAFEANHRHYADIFANGHAPYAIPRGTVGDPERLRRLSAFFFWTAWAAATNRPTTDISYTSNWPSEPLIGNRPTGEAVVWTGVSVWNMVGAGLFGFMINPPIALYYMQGLNTTPVHAHGALFGVYGMLGLGLMLMCLRTLQADREWKDGLVRFGFWAMNVGLMLQIVLSLLPLGLLQTWASV